MSGLVPLNSPGLTPGQVSQLAGVPPELEWLANITNQKTRGLEPTTIRRKLSALSSLFDYLCERNAVAGNPVDGVKRPTANGNEGSTPALGDAQARTLLDAPPADTLGAISISHIFDRYLLLLRRAGCTPLR